MEKNENINDIIYQDDVHEVYKDFSVLDKNLNKKYQCKVELKLGMGKTDKKKLKTESDFIDVVISSKNEKASGKYSVPFISMEFQPQVMAEGDHRSMYLMPSGDMLIEGFNSNRAMIEKDIEVLYDTNLKGISKWLNEKFKQENKHVRKKVKKI